MGETDLTGGQTTEQTEETQEERGAKEQAEESLTADGTFLAQAPDRFKKDQKYLKDLLQHKSWGEVLDRLYAAEAKIPQVPAKPEEYEFDEVKLDAVKLDEHLPEDKQKEMRGNLGALIKARQEEIRALGIELGLGKDAAKRLAAREADQITAQFKAAREEQERLRAEGLKALREEWKGDFDKRAELARRALVTFGKDETVTLMEGMGVADHPLIVKLFYDIGSKIGEDELVPGRAGPTELTPEQKKQASLKDRYKRSPELHSSGEEGGRETGTKPDELARLKGRYPSMDTTP